jgi:transposase
VHDFVGSHVRALEFFGGVPRKLVPDQLKSGVKRACSYEPETQRTYEELAQHYGTAVVPARLSRVALTDPVWFGQTDPEIRPVADTRL